ncbi:MAG TPA: penicillin acylase family protein, partial [Vicinamibacterales bacterium]|nr:penicillin acylase family protein [Vicinamibacterales bacterium]
MERAPLVLTACAVLALAAVPAGQPAAVETTRIAVQGLAEPVEILRDRWGIAHIYAANEPDLFFAQGYTAARDRLFQLELWRRQATGTMAEILGRRELQRDIGARLLRFRGDLSRELDHYHPRARAIVESFVRGINAYIEETERDPSKLPLEFRLLGVRPGRWTPEIVVSRHNGLYGNLEDEVDYARAVYRLGADAVRDLVYFHPGTPSLEPDPAVDLSLITPDILALYRAHRRPIRFTPEDVVPAHRGRPQALALLNGAAFAGSDARRDEGSNNWVVAGRLTLTGRPLLANDPHRAQQIPSLRYWVHLVAPGWNVIGGGEPALPGVSIGHNAYGAWGLTIFGVDIEDLYVYDTNPADPLQYRYRGGWERMRVVRETIPVEGEAPAEVELRFTRHGPVLHEDRERRKAYALRAAWLEEGAAPYLASLRMDQASSWAEFRDACRYSFTPAENMIWADVGGTIGWQAVGRPPLRPNWHGLLPVPGDGRYEWAGYLPVDQLPSIVNPPQGYWATANHNLVPDGYPHRDALAWTWADPFRAARIAEVLESGRRHSVVDMMRLQHDELSLPARMLVPLLRPLRARDDAVERARRALLDWNHVLDRDSVAAGIYVAWERRLVANLRAVSVPQDRLEVAQALPFSLKRAIDRLVAPDGRFGADPIAGRDALLLRSLEDAVADLAARLGEDQARWQYGQARYKHVLIRHPLSGAVEPALAARLDVGPRPRGGYAHTVNNTGGGDNQTTGASFRLVADLADWDASVGTNSPGQSGDPDSRHYRDLFDLWAEGTYFPILFTRDRVVSAAEARMVLVPARASADPGAAGP